MFLSGDGGEDSFDTNVNYFLEEYGISVNNDAVVRAVFYKYLHPKEVYIANGIVNNSLLQAVSTHGGKRTSGDASIVYPYGPTLNVAKPAKTVLSSGYISYPLNRPIAAVSSGPDTKGKVCVIGASRMCEFSTLWLHYQTLREK